MIVVRADQAPTSSLEQAENARGSKSSSTTAFFDSIGQTGEVRAFNREVGFTPNSGRGLTLRKLTLCAKSRHFGGDDHHSCSADIIGSKPVFVTTVTAADDARSAMGALAALRSLASEATPAMEGIHPHRAKTQLDCAGRMIKRNKRDAELLERPGFIL